MSDVVACCVFCRFFCSLFDVCGVFVLIVLLCCVSVVCCSLRVVCCVLCVVCCWLCGVCRVVFVVFNSLRVVGCLARLVVVGRLYSLCVVVVSCSLFVLGRLMCIFAYVLCLLGC